MSVIEYCDGGCGFEVDDCHCEVCEDCGCEECECECYCDECGDNPCCCQDPAQLECQEKVNAILRTIYDSTHRTNEWWAQDDAKHWNLLEEERYDELLAIAKAELELEAEWE